MLSDHHGKLVPMRAALAVAIFLFIAACDGSSQGSSSGSLECSPSSNSDPISSTGTVKVDPEVCYPFEGWGTSLAWWAVRMGSWPEDKKSAVADLVFDPSKGLGFNVVRYNI